MITWNYRVFQELAGDFVIREVFYEKDQIIACTQNPVEPFGNTLEELRLCLQDFQQALNLPVLHLDDIPHTETKTDCYKSHENSLSAEDVYRELGLNIEEEQAA